MKTVLALVFSLFAAVLAAQDQRTLGKATIVRVWDLRVSEVSAQPIEIHDRALIGELAIAIGEAPGEWKNGEDVTIPTGNFMIAFWDDKVVIARFGLGDEFLVRGNMGDWQMKRISKELGLRLVQKANKAPNQALQHNDPSCHESCLRTPRASRGRG